MPFQLLHTPAGDRVLFIHNWRYSKVLQGGMGAAPSFPKVCVVLVGTLGALLDLCIHRDLLPEEAIVTHLITCQGRDHLVNIRSERHSLVIVNVHFEPELTLRQLRGRLGLVHPHWPAYPSGCGRYFG